MDSPGAYLKQKGIKTKNTGGGNVRFDCPVCGKSEGFDLSTKSGLWHCKRASCGEKGNLYKLKVLLGDALQVSAAKNLEKQKAQMFRSFESPTIKMVESLWSSKHAKQALAYVQGRKLDHRILRFARVGWAPRPMSRKHGPRVQGQGLIAIPYFKTRHSKQPYNGKLRWVPPEPESEGRYTKFRSGELGLYAPLGLDLSVPVLLVGGELDALSLAGLGCALPGFMDEARKKGGKHCSILGLCPVAVPNGEGGWSDVWTEMLEPAADIIVAFDADEAGHRGAESVAAKLGKWRVRIAEDWPGDEGSDPNRCLQDGTLTRELVLGIIERAKSPAASSISTAVNMADTVAKDLTSPLAQGFSTGLDALDTLLGGLRPWEINVVTGHTGCGKSTFCFQLLMHATTQLGLKGILCPFEGGASAGLATMAHMHSGATLDGLAYADVKARVEALGSNLYVLNHTGPIEPDAWRETLRYCVGTLGVRLVVVDLLNMMVPRNKDQWQKQAQIVLDSQTIIQDRSLGAAHMLLIAHPKENTQKGSNRDNYQVSLADLKGGSGLAQDCAGAISVFRPRRDSREPFKDGRGYYLGALRVLKQGRNRKGEEGRVPIWFDREKNTYTDKSEDHKDERRGQADQSRTIPRKTKASRQEDLAGSQTYFRFSGNGDP